MAKTSHVVEKKVEFSETDMAGIVHFSNYLKYMELAEISFFESLGMSLVDNQGELFYGWPRVRVSCQFSAPLRFRDRVRICLYVREIHSKAIKYEFSFYKVTDEIVEKVAKGEMTTVFVSLDPRTKQMAGVSLPKELLDQIGEASIEEIKQAT